MLKAGGIAGICAAAGAAAGIAGSAAAPSTQQAHKAARPGLRGLFRGGPGLGAGRLGVAGPPVHVEMVVPNSSNGFQTVTMDRGTFQSLSGDKLTISEGTKTKVYKSLALTIPSTATVERNEAAAKLTDLKSGDQVNVIQSPQGTTVIAFDAKQQPGAGAPGFEHRFRHDGPFGPGNGQSPPAPGNGRQTPSLPGSGQPGPPPGLSTN
jgi:hypothetical protein